MFGTGSAHCKANGPSGCLARRAHGECLSMPDEGDLWCCAVHAGMATVTLLSLPANDAIGLCSCRASALHCDIESPA